MAGLFGVEVKDLGTAVGAVGTVAKDLRAAITGKSVIDPVAQAQLEAKILEIEHASMVAQLEVAKTEATSTSMFIAGARPAIMWICGLILMFSYVINPILTMFGLPTPLIDMGDLWPVITGILGLGTMRSFDKRNGVVSKH